MKKAKRIIADLVALFIILAGFNPVSYMVGGGTAELRKTAISESAESEGAEMAKTTDRITINDEDYMVHDSVLNSAVDVIDGTLHDISQLFESTNLLNKLDSDYQSSYYLSIYGTGSESDSYDTSGYIAVEEGQVIRYMYYAPSIPASYAGNIRSVTAYDSSKNVLSAKGQSTGADYYTVPQGVAYIRVVIAKNPNSQMIFVYEDITTPTYEDYYSYYKGINNVTDKTLSVSGVAADGKATGDALALRVSINEEQSFTDLQKETGRNNIEATAYDDFTEVAEKHVSKNLFNINDADYQTDTIINAAGVVSPLTGYSTTGYISVKPGNIVGFSSVNQYTREKRDFRTICYYDKSKNVLSGSNTSVAYGVKIPQNCYYIRFSPSTKGYMESDITFPMVAVLSSASEIPEYEPYYDPYYAIKKTSVPKKASVAVSTLSSGTALTISNYPKYLRFGTQLSATAFFSSFGTAKIGWMESGSLYQGYLEIDSTKAYFKTGIAPQTVLEVSHGLTFADFISVIVSIDRKTASISFIITTNGGTFTYLTSDEQASSSLTAGTPTLIIETAATDVVFTASSSLFDSKVWIIGDSYFGGENTRLAYYLMTWGYSGNILIDAVGGLNSTDGYKELEKLLTYGTPDFLVWYLGMNDYQADVANYYPIVQALCKRKGITLILNRVPYVPSRLTINAYQNDYVLESGERYIDSYTAVGADSSGNWYTGYLSDDGVHPTALGAQALAARLLIDVPEIQAQRLSE